MPTLKGWYVISATNGNKPNVVWKSPELLFENKITWSQLVGVVFDHAFIKDDCEITTSAIRKIYRENGKVKALTISGTIYQLEEIDKKYGSVYPDTVDRLIANFTFDCNGPSTVINHN